MEEVSLGDYMLSVVSLRPGLDGCLCSSYLASWDLMKALKKSFEQVLLEYPHYTRPRTWRNRNVPVLLSAIMEGTRMASAERRSA